MTGVTMITIKRVLVVTHQLDLNALMMIEAVAAEAEEEAALVVVAVDLGVVVWNALNASRRATWLEIAQTPILDPKVAEAEVDQEVEEAVLASNATRRDTWLRTVPILTRDPEGTVAAVEEEAAVEVTDYVTDATKLATLRGNAPMINKTVRDPTRDREEKMEDQ